MKITCSRVAPNTLNEQQQKKMIKYNELCFSIVPKLNKNVDWMWNDADKKIFMFICRQRSINTSKEIFCSFIFLINDIRLTYTDEEEKTHELIQPIEDPSATINLPDVSSG